MMTEKEKYNMKYELLGENIQIIRKLRGMKQQELADRIGINMQSLSKIERGVNYPTFETLEKIISVLGVTPNELLSGDWENTSHMEQAIMGVVKREEHFNTELSHLKDDTRFETEADWQEYEKIKLIEYITNYISSEKRKASELYELKRVIQSQKLQKVLDRYDELHSLDLYAGRLTHHESDNPYDEELLYYLTDGDEKDSIPDMNPNSDFYRDNEE